MDHDKHRLRAEGSGASPHHGQHHHHHHQYSRGVVATTPTNAGGSNGFRSGTTPGRSTPTQPAGTARHHQAYPIPGAHSSASAGPFGGVLMPKEYQQQQQMQQQQMQRSRQSSLSTVSIGSSASSVAWENDTMNRASRYSTVSSVSTVSSSYPGSERWTPQQTTNACYQCQEKFTILKRSHRCRRCVGAARDVCAHAELLEPRRPLLGVDDVPILEPACAAGHHVAAARDIHGIGFDSLSWNQKFAIRWTARKAAEKKKSFLVMSSLLTSLGLSKYAPIFEQEEIDIESLCLMNAGHLRDLGIPFGPRMKLLNAAACLADFNEEEEEDRPSMESRPVTPISRFKQKRAEMKHYRASLVRRVQQSAVRIAILTNEGELCNVGSGIIIHESGLIATARHCLQGEQFDCIYSDDYMILVAPTESTSLPPLWKYHAKAIPECCDEELDYALLRIDCEVISDPPSGLYIGDVTDRIIARNWNVTKIEGTSASTIGKLPAVLIGNSNNVEPGDEMWMFGYPSSGHNTITVHHAICSGTDSQVYDGEEVDKAMLRTAAQLDNGFSGGAAVDKKGQLVGLISFSVLRQDRVRAINMVKGAIELAKRTYIEV
ncbi:Serine protease family s01b, partial [Globisporangium splendens]